MLEPEKVVGEKIWGVKFKPNSKEEEELPDVMYEMKLNKVNSFQDMHQQCGY